MKRFLVFLASVLAVLPGVSCATSPSSRPIETLFKNATAVIVGKVTDVTASCDPRKNVCNSIYRVSFDEESIKQLKPAKGSSVSYESICSNVPLEIGSAYTLFIEAPTRFNTAGSNKCLLAIDFDGVFEKIGSYVYRVGAPDAKIIVDFEGAKYLTNAVVEPGFEQAMGSLSQEP
ncbi:MAG TPA: hypothetical protein VIT90_01175 [Lysobacter sp.]